MKKIDRELDELKIEKSTIQSKATECILDMIMVIDELIKKYIIGDIKIVDELPPTGTGKTKRNKVDKLLTIDLDEYEKKEIVGGLRCNTFLLKVSQNLIYQEYFGTTIYQAKKKYDITNLILINTDLKFIPKALSYGIDGKKTWLITEYKSGKMLSECRKFKNFSLNYIAKDIAKTLYIIHNVKFSDKYGWISNNTIFAQETFIASLERELERLF